MQKIKKIPILIIFTLLLSILSTGALALDDPQIDSGAAILADVNSGRMFFSKDTASRRAPASLTKIMTVLLAVEAIERGDASLSDRVTARDSSFSGMVDEGSTANIVVGETLSLEELLYCAMVESANEGCNIIAEHISGSVTEFLKLMNERAVQLGCTDTHFTNTHGLPDSNHYTTAQDLYLITVEAMGHDLFMEVCNTVSYTVPATNMSDERVLLNTNGLINANSPYYKGYYYQYARGIKTGHTAAAGYCLISTAEKDGMNLVAVILGGVGRQNVDGSNYYGNFADSITLYNWAFNNFSIQEILSSSELVCEVPVTLGSDADSVTLRPKSVISALLPNDEDLSKFERQIIIFKEQEGEELTAPIAAGEVIGEITISKDGVSYGSTPLVASTNVELSKWEYIKTHVVKTLNLVWVKVIFWILILVLAIYILLVVRYRILHKRRREEARRAKKERDKKREAEQRENIVKEIRRTSASSSKVPDDTPPRRENAPPPIGEIRKDAPPQNSEEERAKRDYFEEFFKREK